MTHRVALPALFLLVSLSAGTAHAYGTIVGKWMIGNETAARIVEFSSGGVVMVGDQIGSYSVSGNTVTIDGWNGRNVTMTWTIAGDTLTLTDPNGSSMELTRVRGDPPPPPTSPPPLPEPPKPTERP